MKYKNKFYKKTKRAFDMAISCNYCGRDIIRYRKRGKGGLLRIWLERIVEAEFPIDPDEKNLTCPYCHKDLGNLVVIDGEKAYKVNRSALSTRRID